MEIAVKDQKITIRFDACFAYVELHKKRYRINALFAKYTDEINALVLDFSKVNVIDIKGFNYLIELYIRCTQKQWAIQIIHCHPLIFKQLAMFKLDCLFNINASIKTPRHCVRKRASKSKA